MNSLVLYSTDHCTLCDEALDLLLSMPELSGWSLTVIDIATDPALIERYGERQAPFVRERLTGWLDDLE